MRYSFGAGLIRQSFVKLWKCRAARIIFSFPSDMPTVDVLATVKWNTLTFMYKRSLIKLFFKSYHGMLPSTLAGELIIHVDRPVLHD